jgi:cell division protein ZipA
VELDLQEWLMVILGCVIVGVLAHGFWVQYFGADRLPLKLDKQFVSDPGTPADSESLNQFKAELPNGGARIVTVGDSNIPVSSPQPSGPAQVKRTTTPESVSKEGQDPAPVGSGEGVESDFSRSSFEQASLETQADAFEYQAEGFVQGPGAEAPLDIDEVVDQSEANALDEGSERRASSESLNASADVPYYVVLNVLGDLEGPTLLSELTVLGFAFGDKSIFHRYDDAGRESISLANAVEPGAFDMDTIDALKTPGVTLFMCASESQDAPVVFEEMLYVAVRLAEAMGAKLCDDRRSIMSEHTVAELRQQVQEYQLSGSR